MSLDELTLDELYRLKHMLEQRIATRDEGRRRPPTVCVRCFCMSPMPRLKPCKCRALCETCVASFRKHGIGKGRCPLCYNIIKGTM